MVVGYQVLRRWTGHVSCPHQLIRPHGHVLILRAVRHGPSVPKIPVVEKAPNRLPNDPVRPHIRTHDEHHSLLSELCVPAGFQVHYLIVRNHIFHSVFELLDKELHQETGCEKGGQWKVALKRGDFERPRSETGLNIYRNKYQ